MQKALCSYLGAILVVMIVGCTQPKNADDQMGKKGDTTSSMTNSTKNMDEQANIAIAVVHPTKGNKATGWVTFKKSAEGLRVHADFSGLPEGSHAFHIHLYGDCNANDGTSAGTHFNFEGSSKNPPSDIDRITGNLGVLNTGSNGEATADTTIENAVLNGSKSIIGRAVIVHAKGNDVSQPPIGAAGARLGCGVIGRANPESVMMND